MKRRLTFIFFVVLALLVFTALILVRPSLWTNQLLSYFNTQLEQRYSLEINASRLTGNMLNNLTGEDVYVTTDQDSILFSADGLTLKYSPWKIIIGEFAINEIQIVKPTIYYSEGLQILINQVQSPGTDVVPTGNLQRQPFTIERIGIEEGEFIYRTTDNQVDVSKITGELQVEQGADVLAITGDFSSLQAVDSRQQLSSIEFLINQYSDSLVFEHVNFMYDSSSVSLKGRVNYDPEPQLTLDYQFSEMSIGSMLNQFGIRSPDRDNWNVEGDLTTNFDTYNIRAGFNGKLNQHTNGSGNINLNVSQDSLLLENSRIYLDGGEIRIDGVFKHGVGGNAQLQVQDINLASIHNSLPNSSLSGTIEIRDNQGVVDSPHLNFDVNLAEARLQDYQFSEIQGQLRYHGDTLHVADSLAVQFASAKFMVNGLYTLQGEIDAKMQFQTNRFDYFTQAIDYPRIYGEVLGSVDVNGTIDTTSIRSSMRFSNFGFKEFHFDTLITFLELGNLQDFRDGDLFIQARNGVAWGKHIASANLSAESVADSIIIHDMQFIDGDDHLFLTGGLSRALDGQINTLELKYKNVFVHNRTVLPFEVKQQMLNIARGVIGINDGFVTISGAFQDEDSLQTKVEFTNIDLEPLQKLVADSLYMTGVLNGEIGYRKVARKQAMQSNLEITNVNWKNLNYRRIQILGDYYDGLVSLTKGYLESRNGGNLTISGQFPVYLEQIIEKDSLTLDPDTNIRGDFQFSDLALNDYSQYIPIKQTVSGLVSGSLNLNGNLAQPNWKFNLEVKNPHYDRVSGKALRAQGRYEPGRLHFTDLELDEADGGLYQGEGYLPMVMDLSRGKIRVPWDQDMDLHFWAQSNHVQFLEEYMPNVDVLTGDTYVELYVQGTPQNPIRNGGLSLENGTLEIPDLENSVQNVTLQTTLKKNHMTVDEFSAYMYESEQREVIRGAFNRLKSWLAKLFKAKTPQKSPNVHITGTLDFSKFFKPGLDLNFQGDDIYIRTLLSEIEGIMDAEIDLTGRDSLMISGDLMPKETVLRMDFSGDEREEEIEKSRTSARYVEYNLHSVFPGNLYIRNNQVNAELEGEVWILRHGSERVNYSGTLNIIRGRFYYYNDTFTIEEGQIYFDPTEFNPRLNIVVSTEIEQRPIRITLSGELDNPDLALEISGGTETQGNLSESEILSLLTFNSQAVEEDGLVAPEFQSIFTTYLERQLENYGSRMMGLETFEVETSGGNMQNLQDVSITVGQRVAPNLYFTYGREFFPTSPTNRLGRVGLEYQINRYISFVGEVDEEGYYHFNYRLKYNY